MESEVGEPCPDRPDGDTDPANGFNYFLLDGTWIPQIQTGCTNI